MATVEVCLQRTLQQIHWDPVIGSRVELSLPGRNNGNPKHETSVSGSCFRHFRTKISYLVITTEFHYFQPMFIAGLKHKFKVSHRGDRHHVYIPSISCITLFCLDLLKAPQNNSTYSILSSIYSGFPHIFLCFSRTKLKTSTKRPRGHGATALLFGRLSFDGLAHTQGDRLTRHHIKCLAAPRAEKRRGDHQWCNQQ